MFVVPAHGRLEIATVCLRQLRRTCDTLTAAGLEASAVVVADDGNLRVARELGFDRVRRDNDFMGRKLNDGYELAGTKRNADYMVPLGTDDWIDPAWILARLPRPDETVKTHLSTVVNETCSRMSFLDIPFGDGVRIYTRRTLEATGFRPAEDDRKRAMDASTSKGTRVARAADVWNDISSLCIVDFKSHENLNDYAGCMRQYGNRRETDAVWETLAERFPAEAIAEMRALQDREPVAA